MEFAGVPREQCPLTLLKNIYVGISRRNVLLQENENRSNPITIGNICSAETWYTGEPNY